MRPTCRAGRRSRWAAWLVLGLAFTGGSPAQAGSLRYCDPAAGPIGLTQQSRLLRLAAALRQRLDASGATVALIARSGLALERFGVRYSHAGLALRRGLDTPWGVRQLYFSCDERRPRVFDQGLAGFVQGLAEPGRGHLSVLLLPAAAAAALEPALLDRRRVLPLLADRYSANAYAFGTRYQNCNQWVAEVMALAWGGIEASTAGGGELRAQAQRWLQAEGYRPTRFDVTFPPVRWLGLVPWLHLDDHPPEALDRQQLWVSMPASLEAFVEARWGGVERLELCQSGPRLVVRRGRVPLSEACDAADGDEVLDLDQG